MEPPAERAVDAAPPEDAASVELEIDALAAGGDGVGRARDGRVVFVPFTAPGDRVRVRLDETHRRFARGHVEALLVSGPARAVPRCPAFGRCGGCAWQHVAYPTQVAAKERILRDAFRRIGGLEPAAALRVQPAPRSYGYRTRARVLVRGGRIGFRLRRSRALCATDVCPVLAPPLAERLAALARTPDLPDGEWELASGDGEVRALRLPARGGGRVALRADGDRLEISPGVFAQANADLLGALAGAVHAAAGRGRLALELFAGAGLLTLGLARRFERVIALEAHAPAVRDLRANLRSASLCNVSVLGERLESALARGAFAELRPDALVLDPPRAGLSPGAAAALADLGAPRVAYLSCDAATLARDAARFAARGYVLRELRGFDLLPQTPHVEALALLEHERCAAGGGGAPGTEPVGAGVTR